MMSGSALLGRLGQAAAGSARGGRPAASLAARRVNQGKRLYTRNHKIKFHRKMPLKIIWVIPGEIHWKSYNPLDNTPSQETRQAGAPHAGSTSLGARARARMRGDDARVRDLCAILGARVRMRARVASRSIAFQCA